MKPILALIKESTPASQVKNELGKATEGKKQQTMTRIQNAVSSNQTRPGSTKTRMQKAAEGSDVFGMFNEFERSLNNGSIRIREG